MTHTHDKEVNKITELNLLHDIINTPKRTKIIHSSTIIHVCMNTRRVKAKFKEFQILLDSGCSSTMLMGRLVEKVHLEKDAAMQWHMQAVNIIANLKVKVYLPYPNLSRKMSEHVNVMLMILLRVDMIWYWYNI